MFEGDGSTYNDVILPYLDMFLLVSPAEIRFVPSPFCLVLQTKPNTDVVE